MPLAAVGDVTVIVPVADAQSGCLLTVAVGATGADGTVLTVRLSGADTYAGA